MKYLYVILGACLAWPIATTAEANPVDTLGFGDRGAALGGAMDASDDALSAAAYNPASSTFAARITLGFGYTCAIPDIEINHHRSPMEYAHAVSGALVIPWQMHRDWRLALAGMLYVPLDGFAKIRLHPATEPQVVMWDSRNHRIESRAIIGVNYRSTVSIGVGLSVLGDVAGDGLDLSVNTLPGRTEAQANLQIDVPWRIAPIIGILVQPMPGWRLGLRYMGELSLDADIYAKSYVRVPGTSIEGDTIVQARGLNFFSPSSLSLALSMDIKQWTVSAQIAWQQWSKMTQVASDVDLLIRLGLDIDAISFPTMDPGWHDTWVTRIGLEHHIPLSRGRSIGLRWGYAYLPSPVPAQTGLSSFADSNRHLLATGAALVLPAELWRLSIGLSLQAHVFENRLTRKNPDFSVGEDFMLSGAVYVGSLFMRTELP